MKNRFVISMFGIIMIFSLYITVGYLVPAIKIVFQIINDKPIEETIIIEEINKYLNYEQKIVLPEWEVSKVSYYNDQFTSPSIKISFANEIELNLTDSNYSVANMEEKNIQIDGRNYKFYTDGNKIYYLEKKGISYLFTTENVSDVGKIEHFIGEMEDEGPNQETQFKNNWR